MKEGEFTYYITNYLRISLEKVIELTFTLNEYKKNTINLIENNYRVKRVNIFFNHIGMSAIIISNGDNLILIEFEATYTPEMLYSRMKVVQQKESTKSLECGKEINSNSKNNHFLNVSLERYEVSE